MSRIVTVYLPLMAGMMSHALLPCAYLGCSLGMITASEHREEKNIETSLGHHSCDQHLEDDNDPAEEPHRHRDERHSEFKTKYVAGRVAQLRTVWNTWDCSFVDPTVSAVTITLTERDTRSLSALNARRSTAISLQDLQQVYLL